jgi:hypothetical protein
MLIVRGAISIDAYLWMLNDRLPLPFRGCLVRDALLSANEFVFFIFFNSLDTFILGRCLHSLMLFFFLTLLHLMLFCLMLLYNVVLHQLTLISRCLLIAYHCLFVVPSLFINRFYFPFIESDVAITQTRSETRMRSGGIFLHRFSSSTSAVGGPRLMRALLLYLPRIVPRPHEALFRRCRCATAPPFPLGGQFASGGPLFLWMDAFQEKAFPKERPVPSSCGDLGSQDGGRVFSFYPTGNVAAPHIDSAG